MNQIHSASQGRIHVDKYQQQLAGKQKNNREADEIYSQLEEGKSVLQSARTKLNAITTIETDADFVDPAKLNSEQMKSVLEGIKAKACSGTAIKGYYNAEDRVRSMQKSEDLKGIEVEITNVGKHLEKTCTALPGALGGRMTHSEFRGMTFAEFTAKIEQCDHSISAGLNHNQELNLPDKFRGLYKIEAGVLKRDGMAVTSLRELMHELSSYKTESSNTLHNVGLEKRGTTWHINEAKFNRVTESNPKLAAKIVDIVMSVTGSIGDPTTTNGLTASGQQIFCNEKSITPQQLAEKLGEGAADTGRSRYELAKILQDLRLRCEVLSEHVHNDATESDGTAYMRVSSALLAGARDTLGELCGSEIVAEYNTEMQAPAAAKAAAETALSTAQSELRTAQTDRATADTAVRQADAEGMAAEAAKANFLTDGGFAGDVAVQNALAHAIAAREAKQASLPDLEKAIDTAIDGCVNAAADESPEKQAVIDAKAAFGGDSGNKKLEKAWIDAKQALVHALADADSDKQGVTTAETALATAQKELAALQAVVDAAQVSVDQLNALNKTIKGAQVEKAKQEGVVTAETAKVTKSMAELPRLQKGLEDAAKKMPRIEAKLVEKDGTATVEVSVIKSDGSKGAKTSQADPLKFSTGMNRCADEIAGDVERVCAVLNLNPKSADVALKGALADKYDEVRAHVTRSIEESREQEAAYHKQYQESARVLSSKAEGIVDGIIKAINAGSINQSEIMAQVKDLKATLAADLERTESEIDYREACVPNLEALYKVYTEVDKLGTIGDLGDVRAHISAMWAKMVAELNAQNMENQRTTQQLDNLGRQ